MAIAAGAQFHVLAVDDSLIDRKLIERLLKTSSYQVTTVDSGSRALEFLGLQDVQSDSQSASPYHQEIEVNLVITDYCMPGMTGYELLKKIKETSSLKDIPVVIMSSENVPSRINRCLEEGAEEFFLKPVQLSDMKKLIPHMMKKRCAGQHKEEQHQHPTQSQQSNHDYLSTPITTDSSIIGNNRKALDEALSPKSTRSRSSDQHKEEHQQHQPLQPQQTYHNNFNTTITTNGSKSKAMGEAICPTSRCTEQKEEQQQLQPQQQPPQSQQNNHSDLTAPITTYRSSYKNCNKRKSVDEVPSVEGCLEERAEKLNPYMRKRGRTEQQNEEQLQQQHQEVQQLQQQEEQIQLQLKQHSPQPQQSNPNNLTTAITTDCSSNNNSNKTAMGEVLSPEKTWPGCTVTA